VLAAGALGFVPKRQPASVMLKAIELVLSGGSYVPMEALSLLGARDGAQREAAPSAPFYEDSGATRSAGSAASTAASTTDTPASTSLLQPHQRHLLENLSPRQQDIMRLVHRGWTNKMIARDLGVAEGTVKVHLSVIFRALGVHNRATAIAVINGRLEAGKTL
jgi:DNA-binding NarL/FixJ family response regulator